MGYMSSLHIRQHPGGACHPPLPGQTQKAPKCPGCGPSQLPSRSSSRRRPGCRSPLLGGIAALRAHWASPPRRAGEGSGWSGPSIGARVQGGWAGAPTRTPPGPWGKGRGGRRRLTF